MIGVLLVLAYVVIGSVSALVVAKVRQDESLRRWGYGLTSDNDDFVIIGLTVLVWPLAVLLGSASLFGRLAAKAVCRPGSGASR